MVLEKRDIGVPAHSHDFPLLHHETFFGKRAEVVLLAAQEHFLSGCIRPAIFFSLKSSREMLMAVLSSSRLVNVNLVRGIVLHMTDNLNVKPVLANNPFEGRQPIAVRILGMVLLEQFSDTRPFSCQAGYIPGEQGFQFNPFGRRIPIWDSVQPNISCNRSSERERSRSMLFPLERNRRTYLRTVFRDVWNVFAVSLMPIPAA